MSTAKLVDDSGITHLELYPNGNYKSFRPTVVTQWRMCGHNIKVRADTLVQFYENGNFKSFTLFEDAKFQCYGVEVMVMGGTLVEFYDHGGLKQIITTAQGLGFFRSPGWPYQGYVYDPNTFISFLSNGRVKSVKPMQN